MVICGSDNNRIKVNHMIIYISNSLQFCQAKEKTGESYIIHSDVKLCHFLKWTFLSDFGTFKEYSRINNGSDIQDNGTACRAGG